MSESLEARITRMEDLMAIHQLFIDYGAHLDAGRFDEYGKLFATDGEALMGPMGRAKGPEAITALMSGILGDKVGNTYHIISSPRVDLDGDAAHSEVMWSVVTKMPDGSASLTAVGRHVDDLVKENGAWRFKKRRGYVDLPNVMPDINKP
ncbi:MAG: nuclear transport factor 2 family protein [Acidimicrobiia bacterium]